MEILLGNTTQLITSSTQIFITYLVSNLLIASSSTWLFFRLDPTNFFTHLTTHPIILSIWNFIASFTILFIVYLVGYLPKVSSSFSPRSHHLSHRLLYPESITHITTYFILLLTTQLLAYQEFYYLPYYPLYCSFGRLPTKNHHLLGYPSPS